MNMHYDADILDDYLHGELSPERDASIHAHLEACGDCRAIYERQASLSDWLRRSARAEEREFPPLVRARVWEAVRRLDAAPAFGARLRSFWRPALAFPVAVALAAIVYLGVPAAHGGNQAAGTPAAYLLEEHSALASVNPLSDRSAIVPAAMIEGFQPTGLIQAENTASSNQ